MPITHDFYKSCKEIKASAIQWENPSLYLSNPRV